MSNSVYFSFPANINVSHEDIDTITPATSTDNGIVLFNGIDGTAVKDSIHFVQLPSGHVGIGTDAPTVALDVVGGVKATSTIAALSNVTVGTNLTVTGNETVAKLGIGSAAVPGVPLEVTGVSKFGTPATNYSSFEADGTLVFKGDATPWEDFRVSLMTTTISSTNPPGLERYRRDVGNTSQGVFAYAFDKNTEEEVYFEVQLPHGYKLGTDLKPHIHWGVSTVPAGGTTVRWGLEYTIANMGDNFPVTQTIYTVATDPVTQYKHIYNSFTDIAGSGITNVSTMILCRLFRDVTNDNFANDAAAFDIDFHYEIDTIGSRTPTTK